MMLLEHDAKALLAELGLSVPAGRLLRQGERSDLPGRSVIKAQVPVGGRGKAGGIALVGDPQEAQIAAERILGMTIKGHVVRAVRAEVPVDFVSEAYLSLTLEPGPGAVRILMSPHGGIEVEDEATRAALLGDTVPLDPAAMGEAVDRLSACMPEALRRPLREAGRALIEAFFAYEALLLEINPLFVCANGGWIVGDAKLSVDENAIARRPRLAGVIESAPDLYVEAALKLSQKFDFVLLDPDGDVGLVTTGAGLSMQLIDELTARGRRPYNFCDIRTGEFRGSPERLIQVLGWIAEGPSIRSVLVNFFAGHTDLAEVARLLLVALEAVPQLKSPITVRFIGNGLEQARAILAAAPVPIKVETDLERAIDLAIERAEKGAAANV
jgi:succinyl-CoA synthetase beta subunit